MPFLKNIVVFGSVLFLNPGTNFVLLKVTNIALLRVRWLTIILTPFGAECHGLVIQGIFPSKFILHTSPFLIMLCRFL
jgi:hypothetical protein